MNQAIRDFFSSRSFLEVDSPVLVKTPGTEVHLQYFESEWRNYKGEPSHYFLRSSPEIHLKKIISMDTPKIFQILSIRELSGRPHFLLQIW